MNNPLLVAIAFFVGLSGGLGLMVYRLLVRPAQVRARLGMPVVADRHAAQAGPGLSERLTGLLHKLGNMLSSGPGDSLLKSQFVMAGYRTENAPQTFISLRFAAVAVLVCLAMLLPIDDSNPALRLVLLVGAAGVGWRIPLFMLKKRIAARQERLRLSLPDALDLIIISVEAGLGIDQAIQHVAQELHGDEQADLADELQLIGMEMRAGQRRADALKGFADRTGEDEIRKLAALMIQNDKFGTSMGEAMRNHSEFMRVQRKQQADERASKVGVKLVFPIFFFILPSMMLVAAGPGLLQIFKYLFPMMKQLH